MTKNVTVAISASVHRKARVWAASHNTSLSAIVGYLLEHLDVFARISRQHDADNPPHHEVNETRQN